MRAKEHLRINIVGGAVIGGLRNVYRQSKRRKQDPSSSFKWGEFLVAVLLAAIATATTYRLPDKIEPATNWKHRGPFHSWAVLAASVIGAVAAYLFTFLPLWVRDAVADAFLGNALHLAADATTPMGLN